MKYLISTSAVCVSLSVAIAYPCIGQHSRPMARPEEKVECESEEEDRVKNEIKEWEKEAEEYNRKTQKNIASLKNSNISPKSPFKSWEANSGTNDVVLQVCTDSINRGGTWLVFRELRFSPDGRLLSVSPVTSVRYRGGNAKK